jgi:catechol 2,3-dioxygenase-like lactoylglutathione lyase family enzyme
VSASLKSVGAITLFVEDPQRSKAFYEKVFELPVLFEDDNSAVFQFDNTIINLLARREAPELIAPAAVASPGAGSSFQFSIWVDDTYAVCEQLAALGVELLNGPVDRVWGMRTATFTDPDGHVWEIAQQLGKAE